MEKWKGRQQELIQGQKYKRRFKNQKTQNQKRKGSLKKRERKWKVKTGA